MTDATRPLLEVEELVRYFEVRRGPLGRVRAAVRAVDGVSFDITRGETLGLVGESGSGKTTIGRAAIGLIRPTAGRVRFDGVDLSRLRGAALRSFRRRAQIVFQDPFGSLDPRMTVESALREALAVHGLARGPEARTRIAELLELVGLTPDAALRYPHEFSGGQRQRIGIARALSVGPDLIVCDEPVSALDVSVQAHVLNLLRALQQRFRLACLFIAHDLGVVRHVSDRIAVMYLGRIIEIGPAASVTGGPLHPYTAALLSAVPAAEGGRSRIVLAGDVPDPANPPGGCPFHPRCPHPLRDEQCSREVPRLERQADERLVACHKVPAPATGTDAPGAGPASSGNG
ncbi:MAG: ATP-binding cassette domain-containing protein [Gemmatimonadota bacterium]|jgi:oligopeptide/dipeptide ABC transporter ATP-binding protein